MRTVELMAVAGTAFLLATGGNTGNPGLEPPAAIIPATLAASTSPLRHPAAQPDGRAVFEGKGNCATCHGIEGKGTPLGPNLSDGEWLNISGTLDEIMTVVRQGIAKPKRHPAPMPPMGGARLRDDEIEAVARYVFSLSTAAPDSSARR